MKALKAFVYESVCKGRMMKTPGENMDMGTILRKEPECYLFAHPSRPLDDGITMEEPFNVCPGILIMPCPSHGKYTEEKRWDRYGGVKRAQEAGQKLTVDILFSVWEPGIRLPGFIDGKNNSKQGYDMRLLMEGTEEGLFTLTDWMDDLMEALLGQQSIPGTDMYLEESSIIYGPHQDQSFVVDKRPIYYGFIKATFSGLANEALNDEVEDILR